MRSSKQEVRNPVLALPSSQKLAALDPETKSLFSDILKEISADARCRAETSWKKHKGPMAAYWKAVAVYARHCSVAIRKTPTENGKDSPND
ncbi:hypothetical protein [Leisingera sp. ANG-M7]|uniref:hypothetical protein n=1 Tax=Leisingera sp. ANG-M7 TaxID=1577902 RepID=UPI00057E64C7|nr:hypothetical protein [Leisingera sp. ANG-M7]KIC39391.1 hypothetical protein RA26_01710 [Leisingera sp. ANG-M7]